MYHFSKLLLVVALLASFIVGMPGRASAKPAPGMTGMAAVDNAASAHDRRAHRTSHIRHRRHHHAHH
jgi:hypothetical protein